MSEKCTSMWQRAAAFLARIIARLWPDQIKKWGRAFQAELSEIPDPVASVRWLVGGLMLLTREWWRSFFEGLGRPIGVPPGGPQEIPGKNWTRAPRTPLWATVLLLLATATIVTHPEMRETFSNVWRKNTNPRLEPADWHSVKKLHKEAEINRDPQLLAWLSLLATDPAERIRLSEEAIDKDSSLTWLDYEQSLVPLHDPSHRHYLSMDRLERLQRWDPDNAVPHLLMAEVISEPLRSEALRGQINNISKSGWEKKITQDSRWLAEMERAFSAPKYDNFILQELQLAGAVSKKYGIADAYPTLYILMRSKMLQFDMLKAYADYLLDVGDEAERVGNSTVAASAYWQVLGFSERLSTGQQPIEKVVATAIGMKAGAKLQPVLKSMDRADEAELVGFQIAEWAAWREQHFKKDSQDWKVARRDGLTIQFIVFVVVLLSAMFLVSEIRVWSGSRTPLEPRGKAYAFFCRTADVAPLLILALSAILFFVYHPYAQAYNNYLSHKWLPDIDSMFVLGWVARAVPSVFMQNRFEAALIFWAVVTVGLTLVVVFVSFRMLGREIAARFR
jgi:hypothetical protein